MGLCKLTGQICPCEEELEIVAMRAFAAANPCSTDRCVAELDDPESIRDMNLSKLRILVGLRCLCLQNILFLQAEGTHRM